MSKENAESVVLFNNFHDMLFVNEANVNRLINIFHASILIEYPVSILGRDIKDNASISKETP